MSASLRGVPVARHVDRPVVRLVKRKQSPFSTVSVSVVIHTDMTCELWGPTEVLSMPDTSYRLMTN